MFKKTFLLLTIEKKHLWAQEHVTFTIGSGSVLQEKRISPTSIHYRIFSPQVF